MTDPAAAEPLGPGELVVRRVGYAHPDAVRMVAAVQEEYVARYGGPDRTPLDPAMFEPPEGSFFVAYLGGEPVATAAWRRSDVAALGVSRTVEVKRMYVAPAARGRGVARRLLAHVEADAAARGFAAVVLETGTQQPEAMALYESSGYTPIPAFGFYRDAPLSRCYGKRLPTTA